VFRERKEKERMNRRFAVITACLLIMLTTTLLFRMGSSTLQTPELLVGNLREPGCIATDSDYVYFTEYSGGTVNRIPKLGGARQTLVSGENYPWRLVVDGSYVYYIVHEGGLVKRVPKDGGPSEILASVQTHPWDLVTDSDYVYFTVRDGPGLWDDPNGYVARVAKSGDSVQVLAYAQHPNGIAIDSNYVYFTERDIGNVKRVPKDGGAARARFVEFGREVFPTELSFDLTDSVSKSMVVPVSKPFDYWFWTNVDE
jgi:hypothetical protein